MNNAVTKFWESCIKIQLNKTNISQQNKNKTKYYSCKTKSTRTKKQNKKQFLSL